MWIRWILLPVLCSSWLATAGCQRDANGCDVPAAASVTAPEARRVIATGRVEGWREADVASKLPGRILRFEYGEGDVIDANAPVVELEAADLRAGEREAEARATEARLELTRLRALRAQAIVSASELDRAVAAYRSRAAALDAARATLGYATITAPFRGTLLRKYKEVGEGVAVSGPPDPLFRLADLSRLKVTAEVPEIDIGAVHTGQAAVVSADAYPGERFAATVSRVGDAVGRKHVRSDDPREQVDEKVIEVELRLNADARLKSGMTVDVTFQSAPAESRSSTNDISTPQSLPAG